MPMFVQFVERVIAVRDFAGVTRDRHFLRTSHGFATWKYDFIRHVYFAPFTVSRICRNAQYSGLTIFVIVPGMLQTISKQTMTPITEKMTISTVKPNCLSSPVSPAGLLSRHRRTPFTIA